MIFFVYLLKLVVVIQFLYTHKWVTALHEWSNKLDNYNRQFSQDLHNRLDRFNNSYLVYLVYIYPVNKYQLHVCFILENIQ